MAQSLLFNWIAAYMYEGDAPLAERRAAALALDRDLLRDLLGAEELRELLDPGVLADVELELQCLTDGRRARSADELHDVFRRVGDLTAAEVDLRCRAATLAALLAAAGRAAGDRDRSPASERFAAAEDAAATATPSAAPCRSGCPAAFTEPVPARSKTSSPATPARTGRSSPTSPPASAPRSSASPGRWRRSSRRAAWCSASSGPTASPRVVRRRRAAPAAAAVARRAAP